MDIDKFNNLPITDIGKMIGNIDDLDWMDYEKLENDVSLGSGIQDDRKFIVIKYSIEILKDKYLDHVQCFSQRSKENKNHWTCNSHTIPFINVDNGITPCQQNLIERLIKGEVCTLERNHSPMTSIYIGKRIATPDTWKKKKAVEIIERNWLVCRYTPKYKMCGDVLMHNIMEAKEEYIRTMNFLTPSDY